MMATALVCDAQERFSLQAVTLPDPSPRQIVVRNLYSGVSIGTEFALVRNKISWGPYPLCTGYMATGVVEWAGSEASSFTEGDLVYHRGNSAGMRLLDGGSLSAVSGGHCSHAVLDPNSQHGAGRLPSGSPVDVAALFVPPAVALYGVDMAGPRMGQVVVVQGLGLVGLGVVAACAHRGCLIIAADIVPSRLQIAARLGASQLVDGRREGIADAVRRLAPHGADVVFECTGLPSEINDAVKLCRPDGSFVWQGNYGAHPLPFDFLPAHGRRLRMFFPCDDGLQPCRRAVLTNIALGTLPWHHTLTDRVEAADAPSMFTRIARGEAPDAAGVVVRWDGC